jgi:hypothetical protein
VCPTFVSFGQELHGTPSQSESEDIVKGNKFLKDFVIIAKLNIKEGSGSSSEDEAIEEREHVDSGVNRRHVANNLSKFDLHAIREDPTALILQ